MNYKQWIARLALKAIGDGSAAPGVETSTGWGHPYARGFWACWPDQDPFVPLQGPANVTYSSVLMACINWLGTTLPTAPLIVEEQGADGEWQSIEPCAVCDLLDDPNPWYSGITYWKAFAYWWLAHGNVYYYKARNASGAVVELWMLDPRNVVPEWTQTVAGERTLVYRYSLATQATSPTFAQTTTIPVEDIIHFRFGMDPENPLLGLSPIRSLMNEVCVDTEINTYMAQMMHNFGVPSFVLSPKPSTDAIQNINITKFEEELRAKVSGAQRGKPIVFNKPMELHQFGFSPDQMAVEKASRRPESRVCAVLGIPAIVLGFEIGLERSIYNNLKAAQEQAWYNSVIPTQDYVAEVLEDQLLWERIVSDESVWPGTNSQQYRVSFDRSRVAALQEDRNLLTQRESLAYTTGIKKLSEVRAALGLDSTPEEDVYQWQVQQQAQPQQPEVPPSEQAFGAPAEQRGAKALLDGVPSAEEQQRIARWWNKRAPKDARGLLDAEQVA